MTRHDRIQSVLTDHLEPLHLEVIDESGQHAHGSESHFKIILVSAKFESQVTLNRRRRIQELLAAEFSTGLHALSIHPFTLSEWEKKSARDKTFESPQCASKTQSAKTKSERPA